MKFGPNLSLGIILDFHYNESNESYYGVRIYMALLINNLL